MAASIRRYWHRISERNRGVISITVLLLLLLGSFSVGRYVFPNSQFQQTALYHCSGQGVILYKLPNQTGPCHLFGPGTYNLQYCGFNTDPNIGEANSVTVIPEGRYRVRLYIPGNGYTETNNSVNQIKPLWIHADVLEVKDNLDGDPPDKPYSC